MSQLLLPNCTWAIECGEGTGITTIDRINGNAYTFSGVNTPTWQNSPKGKCIQLASSDSYLSVSGSQKIDIVGTSNFIEMFVKFNAYTSGQQYTILSMKTTSTNQIFCGAYNGGSFQYFWGGHTGGYYRSSNMYWVLVVNTWYHIVHDLKYNTSLIMVNGVFPTTTAASGGATAASTAVSTIGRWGSENTYDFRGSIGYIRIYSGTTLTEKIARLLWNRHKNSPWGLLI